MNVALNSSQAYAAKVVLSAANRQYGGLGSIYGSDWTQRSQNFKHNLNYDFGYPETSELSFSYFYDLWKRNGFAKALVEKTASKTWQDQPVLKENDEATGTETPIEEEIRKRFAVLRFWQALKEADARSVVGKYAGVIFQLGDGKPYDQPVDRVPGRLNGLISVIPAWEGQLEPSSWDSNPQSPTYGQPLQFRFNESEVDPENGKVRSFTVHPDRCFVWSPDQTTFGDSKFESCYNALVDLQKIRGAGGEGFWKNAKAQPVLQASQDIDFNQLASMLGTDLDGIADALDEVVGKWSKGFDESLVLQGMDAKTLGVVLPQPDEFFNIALQEVAASWPIPQKILVGMQTGERASTEDAREWAQTNMGRRSNIVEPNILDITRRFVKWGMLPDLDWVVKWPDLTAPTLMEKLEVGKRMAEINQAMFATGEAVFTDEEIRGVAGYDPLKDPFMTEGDDETRDEGVPLLPGEEEDENPDG